MPKRTTSYLKIWQLYVNQIRAAALVGDITVLRICGEDFQKKKGCEKHGFRLDIKDGQVYNTKPLHPAARDLAKLLLSHPLDVERMKGRHIHIKMDRNFLCHIYELASSNNPSTAN